MQVIVYEIDGRRAVLYPVLEDGLTIEDIAKRDVPEGVVYEIIDADDLPSEPVPPPKLNPTQWQYFLDLTGFRALIDATLDAMPKSTMQERAEWAKLRSVAYASTDYALDVTKALAARFAGPNAPSSEAIEQAWALAADFDGAASL